jgi:hypothetical protein
LRKVGNDRFRVKRSSVLSEIDRWLLEGPPWIKYPALVDLVGKPADQAEAAAARRELLTDPGIQALLVELAAWPGEPLQRHNDAAHLLHKLVFIADSGIRANDPGVDKIIQRILALQSEEGAFQVIARISPHFGGTGQDQKVWMLCDAPSISYALIKLGLAENSSLLRSVSHLAGLGFEHGWPCMVSPGMGKFRGPGRKTDPCPYATLLALKVLSQLPQWRDSQVCRTGAETMLELWEKRRERRPYLFAMGTDFAKLKAPFIWYDILHVLEVLTHFPWLLSDSRLLEMAAVVSAKADKAGLRTPESVWKAWSDWDFGQKKAPSRLISLNVLRILKRLAKD